MQLVIPCTQCNHQNEPQRVFCHHCGTKLDRTEVEAQQAKAKQATAARVKPHAATGPSPFLTVPLTLARVLAYAAVVAALILVVLPPAGTPPYSEELSPTPEAARIAVESLIASAPGRSVVITPQAVNDYMRVYGKIRFAPGGNVTAERTFAILDTDSIQIVLHNAVKGAPFYVGATHRVVMENNLLSVTPTGINIGRLNLPAAAMPILNSYLAPLLKGLGREHELLKGLGGFAVAKEGITITSRSFPAAQP